MYIIYLDEQIYRARAKGKSVPFETLRPILVGGQTGNGKTYLIRKACEFMEIPYVIVDASSMVSTGIRGMSIDELVKTILRKCDKDVKKAEGAVVVFDEVDKLVGGDLYYGETVMSQLLRFVEGGEYTIEAIAAQAYKMGYGARALEKLVYDHFKERLFMPCEIRTEKKGQKEAFTCLMKRISKEIQ